MLMRRFPAAAARQLKRLQKLRTPQQVQDFLDKLPINFERSGETCRSPLFTLKSGTAHCMEGALLAAAAFWLHGRPPLLLDLQTAPGDDDHVVALFKEKGRWGAVSKTNHAVLRYRDPIYKSVRELAMSYFHEYFLDSGRKTLRAFSRPYDLSRGKDAWLLSPDNLWELVTSLDESPHSAILGRFHPRRLRHAGSLEIKTGKLVEWRR